MPYLVVAALLAAVVVAVGSCGPFGGSTAALPRATSSPQTLAQPTSTAQASSSALPAVSEEEAQSVVRLWFEAILAQDYSAAELLTIGNATAETRELAEGLRSAISGRGVEVGLRQQKLDLAPVPDLVSGRSVRAEFGVQAEARVGPFAVGYQQIEGGATFVVDRVEGQPKITDIRDVSGLPAS